MPYFSFALNKDMLEKIYGWFLDIGIHNHQVPIGVVKISVRYLYMNGSLAFITKHRILLDASLIFPNLFGQQTVISDQSTHRKCIRIKMCAQLEHLS